MPQSKPDTATDTDDDPRATVAQLPDGQVDLDLDAEPDVEVDVFSFRLGGQVWEVPRPGIGQALDAEQAPAVSDFFAIVLGDDLWEDFEPVFRRERDANKVWKLARGISRHFGMDPESVEHQMAKDERASGNRAQRRAGGRRVRRG